MSIKSRIIVTLVFSLIAGIFLFPASLIFKWPALVYPSYLAAFCFPFFVLLDWKTDRVPKGFAIILFGLFMGGLYPQIYVKVGLLPHPFDEFFTLVTQLMVLSCAGAGGSIIAAHSETIHKSQEKVEAEKVIIDKTQKVELLVESVDKLKRMMIGLGILFGLLLVCVFWAVVYR